MKKFFAAIAVIVALALVGFGGWYFANSSTTYSGAPEAITIGVPSSLSQLSYSSLILIADDQGLFTKNGLNVTIKLYNTSLAAIDEMKSGNADFAVTSEYSIVGEAFREQPIRLIGTIDKFPTLLLVARKDRGIETISDLKGKKIALTRRTLGEFYLGRRLNLEGIRLQDVTLVDTPATQFVDALANGNVDAVQVPPASIHEVEQRLGNNLIVWPSKGDQLAHVVMASRSDWVTKHPEVIKRLLKALVQAEEYVVKNPAAAQAIVQKRLKYDDATMAAAWIENQFSVSLEQTLVGTMKDEAQWMIKNNLTTEKQIPDFLQYIYLDGLKAVKPGAVTIVQ